MISVSFLCVMSPNPRGIQSAGGSYGIVRIVFDCVDWFDCLTVFDCF